MNYSEYIREKLKYDYTTYPYFLRSQGDNNPEFLSFIK